MINKIQYKDKQSIQNDESVAEENKVTDANMNEIKSVTNNNAEILEQLQEENKELKKQIPSTSVSGNSIHIEDSSNMEFDWKIKGGHKQDGESTPDNSVSISTVSDSVEIDVVNKNFAKINENDWEMTSNNTIKNKARNQSVILTQFKMKANMKYKINLKLLSKPTTASTFTCFLNNVAQNANKAFVNINNFSLNTVKTIEFLSAEDTEFKMNFSGNANSEIFEFQLWAELNDTTEYEQHKFQTVIMPVQQELLEDDYVADVEHHEWRKLILTGDETIIYYDAPSTEIANNLDTAYFTIGISEKAQGNSNNIISNMFKNLYTASTIWGNASSTSETLKESIAVDAAIRLRINKDRLEGYENSLTSNEKTTLLKTYIKSKYDSRTPVTIYYKLATPTDLELTSEQKAVRETILKTYRNITNINLSDELASIDVEYKKDQDTINRNYENRLTALEAAKTNEEA